MLTPELPPELRQPFALHGVSVFSTLRTRFGEPLLLAAYLQRMRRSAEAFGLPETPTPNLPDLEAFPWGLLRLTQTAEGLFFSHSPLTAGPRPTAGVSVAVSSWRVHPQLALHKTGCYLPYRLAMAEVNAFEAWLPDATGRFLADGSRTAPVLLIDGRLTAPAGGLPSVTRAAWLGALAAKGLFALERHVGLSELSHVQAAWICGSGVGVVPVSSISLETEEKHLLVIWPNLKHPALIWPQP